MKPTTSVRLQAYATAGIVGLVASLAVGSPEPALVAVPLLTLAVMGLVSTASPDVQVLIEDAPSSIVEGELRVIDIQVRASERIRRLYLDLGLAEGLDIVEVDGANLIDRTTIWLDTGGSGVDRPEGPEAVRISVTVAASGWGRRSLGPIVAFHDSALGIVQREWRYDQTVRMVSIPSDAMVTELLIPRMTNLHAGDLVSKLRGIGSEFAELRPYQYGDDPRWLNWRVSTRSSALWVNERHPERNGDVVLVVDAQVQVGTGLEHLVDRSVRLTGALLREYGRRRFRIGLVTVDNVGRWIQPGSGEAHRRRLLEQLLSIQEGEASRVAIERAVLRVAKEPALVIILTPMLDDSLAGVAHALRITGIDVALIEIDPVGQIGEPTSPARDAGRRVWRMERERLRDLLAADGIPVAPWQAEEPADVPLAQIASWRSAWRLPV